MSGVLHRYRATCQWEGSTLAGYDHYSRAHSMRLAGSELDLKLSSDPAFHGDGRLANPEQLLLAAAASCQLLSFLAVAARSRLDVLRYSDEAEAEMSEADKPIRINRIRLRPEILMAVGPTEEKIRRLVEQAHHACFIASSLKSEIVIEPTIAFLGGGG